MFLSLGTGPPPQFDNIGVGLVLPTLTDQIERQLWHCLTPSYAQICVTSRNLELHLILMSPLLHNLEGTVPQFPWHQFPWANALDIGTSGQ